MMWDELSKWEDRNNAVAFVVVDTQSLREDLRYYNAFDKGCDEYKCDIDTVSESLVYESIKYAYENIKYEYGVTYESITDVCYEYIVEELNKRGHDKGQIYNAETKTFESVKDFLARYKEKKNAS